MAEYLIQDSTLTSIGNEIRTLRSSSSKMTPATMTSNLQSANTEVNNQTTIMNQILAALDTKGDGGLNFKVVGGDTAPSNPEENTIWINTSTPITSWEFSATQPIASSGKVWICVGTASNAEFNMLKQNTAKMYPISAKQYVNSLWVDVTAKSRQNGQWVDWIIYLYNNGNQCESFTGGFITRDMNYSADNSAKSTPSIKVENGVMTIVIVTNNTGGAVTTVNKIDLSKYNMLCFEGYMFGHSDNRPALVSLNIWSEIGSSRTDNLVANYNSDGVDSKKTIDISSLSGSFYIGFYVYDNEGSVQMRRMWLE